MKPIWSPNSDVIESSQIARWMEVLGRPLDPQQPEVAVSQLIEWSQNEPEAFWDALMKDLGVVWSTPYEQVLDLSKGPEWANWFVSGRTNLALNCVDLPATETPDRLALIGEEEDGTVRRWTFAEIADEGVAAVFAEQGVGKNIAAERVVLVVAGKGSIAGGEETWIDD